MKGLFWVALLIVVLAAFFASTHPDGLDFVAETFNFTEKGQEHFAPMPDYNLKLLPEGRVSTSLAGIAGILIILSVFWLAVYALKKSNKNIAVLILLAVFAASPAFAASPYLYANTSWGALGGGLGLDLGGGKAVDLSATAGSGPSGSTYQLYADYFLGNWGAGITAKKLAVNTELSFDINLQYALEQAISDKLTLGASFTLINYDTTVNADPVWTLLPSIGAYVKLPL